MTSYKNYGILQKSDGAVAKDEDDDEEILLREIEKVNEMVTKGERTKKDILNVAKTLFSNRGYKDVSMQDICNGTGLSKGGLYRHFGNKEEILLELVKKEKRVEQDIAEGVSAVQVLGNLLQVYRDDMKNCKESLAYALFEYASGCEEPFIDSKNTAEKELWHRLVEYGVKTGEFNDVNPDVVMDTFLYSYRGIMMWGRVLPFADETINHLIEAVKVILVKEYE